MRWAEAMWQDARYAVRAMRSSTGLTAVAVLSLALGIGATTAIFSVMYALAFRPLPVAHPEQLVSIEGQLVGSNLHSYPEWEAFRERQDIFADVFAYNYFDDAFDISNGKEQQRQVPSLYVSGNYFRALGVPAAFGRVLRPSDDQPGAAPVCVLGYALWRQFYRESKNILGRTILIDGHEFQIVGVAPQSFFGIEIGETSEVFMPLEAQRAYKDYPLLYGHQTPSLDSHARLISIFGRLKPGERLSQADAGLNVLALELSRALSASSNDESQRSAAPMVAHSMRGSSDAWLEDRDVVLVLMAMAAIALIIACANLGNLLLARATKRQCEIATRLALGATRWRLVRQLLTESVALSLIGSAAGLVIEHWGTQALLWALSWPPDEMLSLDLSWDARLVVFAVGITLCCAVLFGLAPAIRATRISIYSAMNNGVTTGRRKNRFSNSLLVVLQVALSMALLVSAGLLARTLHAFLAADPGFDARGVLTVQAAWNGPAESPQRAAFVGDQLLTQFRSVPGVISASLSRVNSQMYLAQLSVRKPDSAARHLGSYNMYVSSDFFRTRRTPILAGRDFNYTDTSVSLPVAVLSKSMANTLFPGVNPVGLRFRENDSKNKSQDYEVEVIGVAGDMQFRRPDLGPLPILFRPVSQCASCFGMGGYEVRVAAAFPEMEKRLDDAAAAVDSHVALKYDLLSNMFNGVLHRNRAMELIAMTFSLFVGLLAIIGVYGVTSYATSQRTREIGIRMTLGAQPANVFRMILGETITVVLVGLALGVAVGFGAAQMIRGMLWGVKASDPVSFAGAACVMMLVAAIAAFLPARRAAQADPMAALRAE